jgi:hypothetical protein
VTPISRPLQWYYRSIKFITAVAEGRWSDTAFTEHPGVSVMWIVGVAEHLVYQVRTALGQNPPPLLEVDGREFILEVSVGVWALAIYIACAIVLAWFPLRRLFGPRVAWAAVLLMAIDPYHIANSKVLHLDALVSVLMMLSALTMSVYAREGDRRALVISAVCGGLALLTKAPSLFLLPFSALALLVTRGGEARSNIRLLLRRLALPMVAWLGVAAVVFMSLYPAMWTVPGEALGIMIERTGRHTTTAHVNPVYFRGTSHIDDPGPWYYIYTIAFKSSWLSASLALLGLLVLWKLPQPRRRSAMLVVAYVVCFGLQMTLGAKKALRYLLPLFPMFDVLAALGWESWRQGVARLVHHPRVPWVTFALPLAVLAVGVLLLHPYYGIHHNWLWGGIQAAARQFPLQEQSEGLDLAGRWLNAHGGESLRVATHEPDMLMQYTGARTRVFGELRESSDAPGVDYFVFDRNHIVRGYLLSHWIDAWQRYRAREPALRVAFQGVPYVWVYKTLPAAADVTSPDNVLGGQFGDAIELVGYDWQADWLEPGEPLPLRMYWRASQPITTDYTVFVHLVGPDGQLAAQCDSPPLGGTRPTTTWQPDEVIPDTCEVVLPSDAQARGYQVFVGMYSWPSLERLPARAPDGTDLADGRLELASFELSGPHLPWTRMLLAWGGALTVLLVGVLPLLRNAPKSSPSAPTSAIAAKAR